MMKIKEIMSTELVTVSPDTTVKDLARILIEKRISGAPVLDDQDNLVGVVTEGDLIVRDTRVHIPTTIAFFDAVIYLESPSHFEEEMTKIVGQCVNDIMTREPRTVTLEMDVEQAAEIFTHHDASLLPVVAEDDSQKVVGVVTKSDLIKSLLS